MAKFAGNSLKTWRKLRNITAEQLSERISCDVRTIYRYESDEIKPNPDLMYAICRELGDISRWCSWMRDAYPESYGKVHPEIPDFNMQGAIMELFVIVGDVKDLEREVLRDGADGKFDNQEIVEKLKNQLSNLIGQAQLLLNIMQLQRR